MKIDRFNYNGLTYILEYEMIDSPFGDIPFIIFFISTKTAKKIREKKTINKSENHFKLVNKIKNPIAFYRKITKIFTEFLNDYDYVCYRPHDDSAESRVNIYDSFLTSIGFKFLFLNDNWNYFYVRENIKIKKKKLKHFKNMLL